jgi:hypothetical protein
VHLQRKNGVRAAPGHGDEARRSILNEQRPFEHGTAGEDDALGVCQRGVLQLPLFTGRLRPAAVSLSTRRS